MAGNIKGITVEIGGDTTKLDKALQDVNSKARSLQGELRQVNQLLKLDPNNTVALAQKQKLLAEAVENSKNKLKTLEEAQRQVEQQFKNGEVGEEQYRAVEREVEKAKIQLNNYEKELEEVEQQTRQTDQATDELGRSAVEGSQKVEKSGGQGFKNFALTAGAAIAGVVIALQKAWDAGKRVGEKIGNLVKDYAAKGDEIATNAKKFGVSTDVIQEWDYASKFIDVSLETIGGSVGKLAKRMGDYQKGNADVVNAFDTLGVAVYNSDGTFRSAIDTFYSVIDALGKVDDETQADILSAQIFGRSFQELEPLIAEGSSALQGFGKEAHDMGVVLDENSVQSLNSLNDALDRVRTQLGVALAPVVEAMAPTIEKIANWISEKLASPKVQEILSKVGEALATIFEALGSTLQELIDSGKFDKLIDGIVELIPILADFIAEQLPQLIEGLNNILGLFGGINQTTEEFDKKIEAAKGGADVFVSETEIGIGLLKKSIEQDMGNIYDTMEKTFGPDWAEKVSGALDGPQKAFIDFALNARKAINEVLTGFLNLVLRINNSPLTLNVNKSGNIVRHGTGGIRGFAKGGIVTSPEIVQVAERGPEAIIPLDKLAGILSETIRNVNNGINVSMPIMVSRQLSDADIKRSARRLTDVVSREMARRTGGRM